jgi:hypothetical protein
VHRLSGELCAMRLPPSKVPSPGEEGDTKICVLLHFCYVGLHALVPIGYHTNILSPGVAHRWVPLHGAQAVSRLLLWLIPRPVQQGCGLHVSWRSSTDIKSFSSLVSFEALLGFKPIPLWKMEAPTTEPVVIHPGRSRRLTTGISTGTGPTSSGTDINIGGAQYFLGAGGKLPKGGHDVHAELVPIEKKDHLGLLSTMYAVQKSCWKTGLQPKQ